MFINVICGVLGYFIGCFSSAYYLVKLFKDDDIRNVGSGNAGSANTLRNYGAKMGALILVCDLLKGIIAVLIGRLIGGDMGSYICGILCVCGHNWPVFLGFKGGKGVATSLGMMFALSPIVGLALFVLGVSIIIFTKMVAAGSVAVLILYPLYTLIFHWNNTPYVITVMILGALGIYSHRGNIIRMIKGEETKVKIPRH